MLSILDNATSPELEVLWIKLDSQKLHTMFVAAVYAPPNSPFHQDLNDSLVETVDYIHTRFPESGIVILGDFNDMDTDSLASEIDFSKIVDKPTRGDNVLDKVLTNIADVYNRPAVINPIRNSDHRTIIVSPKATIPKPKRQKISIRPIRDSSIRSFGQWLTSVDWSWLLNLENAADMQVSFQDELTTAYERCFPQITFVRREDDKPWMNNRIRSLIDQRQAAYQSGNLPRYSQLRNQVEREIKATKSKFFLGKVSHLKKSQPGKWYKEIRNITSVKKTSNKLPGSHMTPAEQADWINSHFANVCSSLPPLDLKSLPAYLPADSPPPEIQPYQVYNKLKKLKISKSSHTNDIPLRLVREFAVELSVPLSIIFNSCLQSGMFPEYWKIGNIIPIPKVNPCNSLDQLRPISVTPVFARVFEEFLVEWIRRDIADHIDPRQFGSVRGSSTVHYLLSLVDCILRETDKSGTIASICTVDYAKAFDAIDHTVLVTKMINMGVSQSIISVVCDFLSNRSQTVRLSGITSQVQYITCGVPQGTKLGPILFLIMINDAADFTPNRWKYVDDLP